jgi:hypothetical protein
VSAVVCGPGSDATVEAGGLDVRPLGFEPRTCGLRVRCSAVELEARAEDRTVRLAILDRG